LRKGSVAIVPIFLAIALIFWAIWFMGEESDNTHVITNIKKLEDLHENAAFHAMRRKIEILENDHTNELSDENKTQIEQEVQQLMRKNNVE